MRQASTSGTEQAAHRNDKWDRYDHPDQHRDGENNVARLMALEERQQLSRRAWGVNGRKNEEQQREDASKDRKNGERASSINIHGIVHVTSVCRPTDPRFTGAARIVEGYQA